MSSSLTDTCVLCSVYFGEAQRVAHESPRDSPSPLPDDELFAQLQLPVTAMATLFSWVAACLLILTSYLVEHHWRASYMASHPRLTADRSPATRRSV